MAKTRFSMPQVKAFLESRLTKVKGLRSLKEGEESQAFAFDADIPMVLRINRDGSGFAKDKLAYLRFHDVLPVPEINLITPLGEAVACISRRVAGDTLQDLTEDAVLAIAPEVTRLMADMQDVVMHGFSNAGPFDSVAMGSHANWPEWVAAIEDRDWAGIDGVGPALDAVIRFAATCPDMRGLVHGDFGSNNVLCDDGRITGVIDWSEAMIGDPLYDLANILFWRTWLSCMEIQATYLEHSRPEWLADSDRLRAYRLRIGLDTLWHAERDGEHQLAAWARGRLDDAL